jgi:hypothetical protein
MVLGLVSLPKIDFGAALLGFMLSSSLNEFH